MRRRVVLTLALCTLVASAGYAAAGTGPAVPGWLGTAADPQRAAAAVASAGSRLSPEFAERLEHVRPDGTLQVMVSTHGRDAALERSVAGSTTWVQWYGAAPRFLAQVTPDQLAALLADARIRLVTPDYQVKATMAVSAVDVKARSVGGSSGVWAYENGGLVSQVPGLTAGQATGKGVTVAVTDSGIDGTHKDFSGWGCTPTPYQACESRIKAQINATHVTDYFFGPTQPEPQVLPTNDLASGHGTHVAGTIAGNGYYTRDGDDDPARYGGDGQVFGIAPQADLVVTKNGDTLWAGLSLFGLQWQIDHAQEYGIRVSNNSWGCVGGCAGGGPGDLVYEMTRELYNKGVLVVFAAGNDGGSAQGESFAGGSQSPYVLSVAAYDARNRQLADFSSRGSSAAPLPAVIDPATEPPTGLRRPDIAAPGVDVWSARNLTGGAASLVPRVNANDVTGGGSNGYLPYVTMSGTSMATPHVVGAAALLFSACPDARPLDVMRAFTSTTAPVLTTGGGAQAQPFEVGYGGLQVRPALDQLLSQPVCGGTTTPANTAPTAAFTAPGELTTGTAGTFDASSSTDAEGPIAQYAWSFGDGSSATGAVVSHAYRSAGTYTASLTVTDAAGASATATRSVSVVDPARLAGTVSDFAKRRGLEGARVTCEPAGAATTDSDGGFVIEGLRTGSYTCTARADGYRPETRTVQLTDDQTSTVAFSLRRGKG